MQYRKFIFLTLLSSSVFQQFFPARISGVYQLVTKGYALKHAAEIASTKIRIPLVIGSVTATNELMNFISLPACHTSTALLAGCIAAAGLENMLARNQLRHDIAKLQRDIAAFRQLNSEEHAAATDHLVKVQTALGGKITEGTKIVQADIARMREDLRVQGQFQQQQLQSLQDAQYTNAQSVDERLASIDDQLREILAAVRLSQQRGQR